MRRELVDTKRELKGAESDYEQMGWEVVDRSPGRIVVERGRRGSWVWHLLYFVAFPVYGNFLYSAYRRYDRPQRLVIRIRGFAEDTSSSDESGEDAED